jgi:hypothetical protein
MLEDREKTILMEPIERSELPWLKDPKDKPSFMKILKDAIGKDLSKITMPVSFNEPVSGL